MSNDQLKKNDGEKANVRIINKRFNDKCKHISLENFSEDYKTIDKLSLDQLRRKHPSIPNNPDIANMSFKMW